MQAAKAMLTTLLLSAMASPALALEPFEDARQSIVAGHVDAALLVISIGAISVNSQNEAGCTLLHYAAEQGSLDAVNALLERGADPTIKSKLGKTAEAMATMPEVRAVLAAAAAQQAAAAAKAGDTK
jgi:ankyrin repeat protein